MKSSIIRKIKKYVAILTAIVMSAASCFEAVPVLAGEPGTISIMKIKPTDPEPDPKPDPEPEKPVTYKDIYMSESSITMAVGGTQKLTAKNAATSVTWWSDDDSVAKVSGGTVTAVSKGTTKVWAKANGGKYASCEVTVDDPKISKTDLLLVKGEKASLNVKGCSHSSDISWGSENSSVAKVDKSGNITAKGRGKTKVYANVHGVKKSCTVTVKEPEMSNSYLYMYIGDKYKLKLTGWGSNATWRSSKNSVVTVTSRGRVKAVKSGTANITATVHGKKYKCSVTVVEQNIYLDGYYSSFTGNMRVGDESDLEATWDGFSDSYSKGVSWKSSDSSVASVSGWGTNNAYCKVTAKKAGTATITATRGTASDTYTITVKNQRTISLNYTTKSMIEGDTASLEVTYNDFDSGDSKSTSWSSSDTSVATVSSYGTVTAKKAGTATITAKCGTLSATCKVTVTALEKSISLNKTTLTLKPGATEKLTVTYKNFKSTDSKSTTWTSSNTKVAKVSSGTVTAVAVGTATITAKCGSYTAKCTVTVAEESTGGDPWEGVTVSYPSSIGDSYDGDCRVSVIDYSFDYSSTYSIFYDMYVTIYYLDDSKASSSGWSQYVYFYDASGTYKSKSFLYISDAKTPGNTYYGNFTVPYGTASIVFQDNPGSGSSGGSSGGSGSTGSYSFTRWSTGAEMYSCTETTLEYEVSGTDIESYFGFTVLSNTGNSGKWYAETTFPSSSKAVITVYTDGYAGSVDLLVTYHDVSVNTTITKYEGL